MMENFIGAKGYFMVVSPEANPFRGPMIMDFKIKIIQSVIEILKNRQIRFQVNAAVICKMKSFDGMVGHQIKAGSR